MTIPAPDPASIVSLAWAISGKYSDAVDEQDTAQKAESHFAELKKQMIDNQQYAYSNDATTSLYAASRTMALIVRHRNNEFATIEDLKTNEVEMYKNLQSFTASLQSTLPRLSGIAIGGSTIPALIHTVYGTISQEMVYLLMATFGGIGYLLSEVISARIAGKKINQTIIKYDQLKHEEYQEFLERSALALRLLLDDLVDAYKKDIDDKYDLPDESRTIIIKDIIDAARKKNIQNKN